MDSLLPEAQRQLAICNACRYCEGFCAVFPALERRRDLDAADVQHLANLCHDCRACLYACMYAPPHEFGVNIPQVFAQTRREVYDTYSGTQRKAEDGSRSGIRPVWVAVLTIVGLVLALTAVTRGIATLVASHPRAASPYSVMSYPAILLLALVPFLLGIALMLRGARRYARETHGGLRALLDFDALWRATGYAASLHYMRGGGNDCYYSGEEPSPARRRFHLLLSFGFLLCLVSTIAAAVLQDILGSEPPYSAVSVPVLTGCIGGVGMVIGCVGIISLKMRSDRAGTDLAMTLRDYALLGSLLTLGATGLLTVAARKTSAYGLLFDAHLAAVVTCFLVVPYSKFVHLIYRFLAIVQDNLESSTRSRRVPRPRA